MNAEQLLESFQKLERTNHKDGTISLRAPFELWFEIHNLLVDRAYSDVIKLPTHAQPGLLADEDGAPLFSMA